jgi:septum formation protein
VQPADVDERITGSVETAVLRLAAEKARRVGQELTGKPCVVLAADTLVVLDGQPLGKPVDAEEARSMLARLRGRWHTVITAVADHAPHKDSAPHVASVSARVRMRDYAQGEIAAYVATGEPLDCAGAYAIQSEGGKLVAEVDGCYATVVGLPLGLAAARLTARGLPPQRLPGEVCYQEFGFACPLRAGHSEVCLGT